jgi:hypothetical protein
MHFSPIFAKLLWIIITGQQTLLVEISFSTQDFFLKLKAKSLCSKGFGAIL